MFENGLFSYAADVFVKSGGVGLVTGSVFFVCLGLGMERLLFWSRLWGLRGLLGIGCQEIDSCAARTEGLVRAARYAEASAVAKGSSDPALRIFGKALVDVNGPDGWPHARDRAVSETLRGNAGMGRKFLVMAIQGFGLLGMLGTCKGLYTQLSSVGGGLDAASLQGMMGGMGEAFTTTLVGLTAAGLTTLIYLPNEMMVDRFRRSMDRFNVRIQAALQSNTVKGEA